MPARPAWRHGRRRAPARPRGRRVKTPCRTPRTWRAQSHAGPESMTCEFEVCAGSTQEERTWPTSKCSCLSFARPAGVEATAGGTLAVSPVTASPACVDLDRTAGGSLDASGESVRHRGQGGACAPQGWERHAPVRRHRHCRCGWPLPRKDAHVGGLWCRNSCSGGKDVLSASWPVATSWLAQVRVHGDGGAVCDLLQHRRLGGWRL